MTERARAWAVVGARLITTSCSLAGWGSGWQGHTMAYSGVMARTQVYLRDEEIELLDRVARATGASRSELIRRAIHSTFGQKTTEEKLRGLESSAASWRGRTFTGAEYVDAIRTDFNERLRHLGLE